MKDTISIVPHPKSINFKAIFYGIPCGAGLQKLLFDEKGEPSDYLIVDVNPVFSKSIGLRKDYIINRKASELLSQDEIRYWLGILSPVALSGTEATFDMYNKTGQKFNAFATCPEKNFFLIFFSKSKYDREDSQALLTMKKTYSVLGDIYISVVENQLPGHEMKVHSIIERVCDSLSLDFSGVWLLNDNKSFVLRHYYFFDQEKKSSLLQDFKASFPYLTKKVQTSTSGFFFSREMISDPSCTDIISLETLGFKYLYFSPIIGIKGKKTGVICFASRSKNPYFCESTKRYLDIVVHFLTNLFTFLY